MPLGLRKLLDINVSVQYVWNGHTYQKEILYTYTCASNENLT